MAEGRSNAAIAARLFVTEKAVSKHTDSIFTKLDLPPVRRRQPPRPGRARLPERLTGPLRRTARWWSAAGG